MTVQRRESPHAGTGDAATRRGGGFAPGVSMGGWANAANTTVSVQYLASRLDVGLLEPIVSRRWRDSGETV